MTPDERWEQAKKDGLMSHENPAPETVRFMERQLDLNEQTNKKLSSIEVLVKGIDERGKSIHEQTIKTNGRVTKLEAGREEDHAELDTFKEKTNEAISEIKSWGKAAIIVVGLINLAAVVLNFL